MDKSSNIIMKSTKSFLLLYRLLLKICFATLTLAVFIVCIAGLSLKNSTLSFLIITSFICAIFYSSCYYIYKLKNNNSYETTKRDPMGMQIKLIVRILVFCFGAVILFYGASVFSQNLFFSILIMFVGLVCCETLFNNSHIFSHLSTLSENLAAGTTFSFFYFSCITDLSFYALIFFFITIALVFLQEFFYHFRNIGKHVKNDINIKVIVIKRIEYFIRNFLIYSLIYIGIIILNVTGSLYTLQGSEIIKAIMEVSPLLISIISVAILLYNQFFSKKIFKKELYKDIVDLNQFKKLIALKYSRQYDNSLNYVVENMNKINGYTRYSGEDYYFHCLNTAYILYLENIVQEDIINTALLHDCVEDIDDCSYNTIKTLTNDIVASAVEKLTKQKNIDYKNDSNLKNYLSNILENENATLVKIADRMHNMSTLTNMTFDQKQTKINNTKKYYIRFCESAKEKYPKYNLFFEKAIEFFSNL